MTLRCLACELGIDEVSLVINSDVMYQILLTYPARHLNSLSPGEFNPEDFEDDAIRTQPTAHYQAVGESEPVTDNAPIALALGPGPTSSTTGDGDTDKQAIPVAASEEAKKEEEVGQEGVVSVVVSEQESDEVGRGSDEQLIKADEN